MIDVVAAVIKDGSAYLACRRLPMRGSKWEFPGGKVEEGELFEVALRREIEEELGVRIRVGHRLATVEDSALGIRLHSYSATLQGPRPMASTDHDRLDWFELADLAGLDWSDADVATVNLLLAS